MFGGGFVVAENLDRPFCGIERRQSIMTTIEIKRSSDRVDVNGFMDTRNEFVELFLYDFHDSGSVQFVVDE